MALYMKEAFEMNGFLGAAAAGMLPPSALAAMTQNPVAMAAAQQQFQQRAPMGLMPSMASSLHPGLMLPSQTGSFHMPPTSTIGPDPTSLLQAAISAAAMGNSNSNNNGNSLLSAVQALMQHQQQQQQFESSQQHHQQSPDTLKSAFSAAVSGILSNLQNQAGSLTSSSSSNDATMDTPRNGRPSSSSSNNSSSNAVNLTASRKHPLTMATTAATPAKQPALSPTSLISVQVNEKTPQKNEEISPANDSHKQNQQGSAAERIREAGARVLFGNVRWLRSLPALSSLAEEDQRLLLERSWKDLFLVSWQQTDENIDLNGFQHEQQNLSPSSSPSSDLGSSGSNEVTSPVRSKRQLAADIDMMTEIGEKFRQVKPDVTEATCLKAIALFQSGVQQQSSEQSGDQNDSVMKSKHVVSALHEQAQLTLSRYVQSAYPDDSLRLGKLMLLLMSIKSAPVSAVENVFFKKTIGHIPMERLVYDLFRSSDI